MKNAFTTLRLPAALAKKRLAPRSNATRRDRAAEIDPTAKAVMPAVAPPPKRGRVIPVRSAERCAAEYGDPARALQRRQFIEFGCGACRHHQRKPDLSAYHCQLGIGLWPDGTNKDCRWFLSRRRDPRR